MVGLLKIVTFCFAISCCLLGTAHAVDSGSSGSIGSVYNPPPSQEVVDSIKNHYDGHLDLVRMPASDYNMNSPRWAAFAAEGQGKHVVIRTADRQLYAMDRVALGPHAAVIRAGYVVPGDHLYRIWRITGQPWENGKRQFVDLAFVRRDSDFRWKNFPSLRLSSLRDLTTSIAHI